MKRIFEIIGIAGLLIWAGAVLLRGTDIMQIQVAAEILWRAPNFGAVLVANGFVFAVWPLVFKKPFALDNVNLFLSSLLVLILAFEAGYGMLAGAAFDLWDVFASLAAVALLVLVKRFKMIYEDDMR